MPHSISDFLTFDYVFNTIVGISSISMWWMAWQERREVKGKMGFEVPKTRWTLYIIFSLIPIAALAYHNLSYQMPPEFDDPQNALIVGWGSDPSGCWMNVGQKAIEPLRGDYKQTIACFQYDGKEDVLDDPRLQVGGPYDIEKDGYKVLHAGSGVFPTGVNIVLLLLPNSVATNQFTTLRQARALGVKILDIKNASTAFVPLAH